MLGGVFGGAGGGDFRVDLVGVRRPVPGGDADEGKGGAGVAGDEGEQVVFCQIGLRGAGGSDRTDDFPYVGAACEAGRRPVGPGRNVIPGCSLVLRASSTSLFVADDRDMPGFAATNEASLSATGTSNRTGVAVRLLMTTW